MSYGFWSYCKKRLPATSPSIPVPQKVEAVLSRNASNKDLFPRSSEQPALPKGGIGKCGIAYTTSATMARIALPLKQGIDKRCDHRPLRQHHQRTEQEYDHHDREEPEFLTLFHESP